MLAYWELAIYDEVARETVPYYPSPAQNGNFVAILCLYDYQTKTIVLNPWATGMRLETSYSH